MRIPFGDLKIGRNLWFAFRLVLWFLIYLIAVMFFMGFGTLGLAVIIPLLVFHAVSQISIYLGIIALVLAMSPLIGVAVWETIDRSKKWEYPLVT